MTNPIFTNEKSTRSLSDFEFLHDPSDKNSKLGVGSFASVKLAKEKKTGKQCAIKIIDMHPSKVTSSDLHNIRTEITIHRKLEHPNIIQFHDYIQKDHNVYLVLEFADSGNLYSHIHKRKNHLAPEDVFRFFYQTCLAIHYLHQNDVLHRDIKPENLLLDKNRNIKLCDFGWSTRRITEKRLTFCGTYEYMAPEIVHKKPYDYRVDIWSLGVLLYELIHKEAPYKGRSLPEITKSLEKSHIEFSSRTTPEARDLILKILRTNPNDRLSVAQILSHPYVQSHLSPEEDDSLEIEEVAVVSPRELRPMNTQSVFCESPKQKLRRDNENFKSEIIMTSDDGIFAEILNSKTRKNSHNHLYNSFNMPCSVKNKERSKERSKERTQDREKREKGKFINIAKSLTQGEGLKTSMQDLAMNTKTTDENLSAVREHVRSSPSLAQKAFEKAGLEDKNIRSNLERKRKIFENTILSPNFKNKVDGIMLQLSSHTTTHKLTDRTPSLFNSKPAQTPSSEVPIGFKYFDENSYFGTSLSSMRTKTDLENGKMSSMRNNNSKSNFQKKIAIVKADTFSTLTSPIAYTSTLTTRSKVNTRGSDSIDQENFALAQKLSDGLKSATNKNFANALLSTDQNKFKGQQDRLGGEVLFKKLQKGQDIKKKQSLRSEEGSSGSLHISSLSERRNENKENKKSLIKDKENNLKFREEYAGRWEF